MPAPRLHDLRHRRYYYFAALSDPSFVSFADLVGALVPPAEGALLDPGTELDISTPRLTITHAYLVTPKAIYSSLETVWDDVRTPNGDYAYDLYALRYTYRGHSTWLIGAPFFRMCRELALGSHEGLQDRSAFQYEKLNVDDLVANIVQNQEHDGGRVRVTRLGFSFTHQNFQRMVLQGDDVLQSEEYQNIAQMGLRLSPRDCTIHYAGRGAADVWLDADRYGNYGFRVESEGMNLPYIAPLLAYLIRTHVLVKATAEPFGFRRRGYSEDEAEHAGI